MIRLISGNAVTCKVCGQVVNVNDAYYIEGSNGEYVCSDCYGNDALLSDAGITYCAHCDNPIYKRDANHVIVDEYGTTEDWCDSCTYDDAIHCDDCGALVSNDASVTIDMYDGDIRDVCTPCFDEHYTRCDQCGHYVHNDDVDCETRSGWDLCPDCAEAWGGKKLKCYGHTDAHVFKDFSRASSAIAREMDARSRYEKLYIGVELETEAEDDPNDLAEDVCDAAESYGTDLVECKEDGSLSDGGCEIVSQPATPLWHTESGFWHDIISAARADGATSHDAGSCGLHFHVDRGFFGIEDTQNAAAMYMDLMISTHMHVTYALTRRDKDHLDQWARPTYFPDSVLRDPDPNATFAYWDRREKWSRYRAINLRNYETIEFRCPRGTLREASFYGCLSWFAGMCILAKALASGDTWRYARPQDWTDQHLIAAIAAALATYDLPTHYFIDYVDYRGIAIDRATLADVVSAADPTHPKPKAPATR